MSDYPMLISNKLHSFRNFCPQFYSYLVLFAERRVENHKVAEDIVQEIFINIWESNKQYNSINGFKAYLYEAVSNRCADYWKHRAVEEKYMAHVLYEQKLPDFSVQEEEILRELYAAIGELPQRSQEVILLSLEGKKNQEIAQLLNLSVLTVKTHKKNAFRYLKNRLRNLVLLVMIMQISKKEYSVNVPIKYNGI